VVISDSAQSCLKYLIVSGCMGAVMAAPAFAQTDDANVAQYQSVLNEIANLQLTMDRQSVYVSTQEAEMDDLRRQIEQVSKTNVTIPAMIDKMAVAIEEQIKADIPFKVGERYARLDSLKETIADATASPADKMRKALAIYDIEVSYGQSLEAYDADAPANGGERRKACDADLNSPACAMDEALAERIKNGATFANIRREVYDGTYLRYGRLSLAYVSADGLQALRYNNETKEWDALPATRALEVRRGIRIAKGESAPGVVSAPVIVAN